MTSIQELFNRAYAKVREAELEAKSSKRRIASRCPKCSYQWDQEYETDPETGYTGDDGDDSDNDGDGDDDNEEIDDKLAQAQIASAVAQAVRSERHRLTSQPTIDLLVAEIAKARQ